MAYEDYDWGALSSAINYNQPSPSYGGSPTPSSPSYYDDIYIGPGGVQATDPWPDLDQVSRGSAQPASSPLPGGAFPASFDYGYGAGGYGGVGTSPSIRSTNYQGYVPETGGPSAGRSPTGMFYGGAPSSSMYSSSSYASDAPKMMMGPGEGMSTKRTSLDISGALASDQAARQQATEESKARLQQAISGTQAAESASLAGLSGARGLTEQMVANPEVLGAAIQNQMLGQVFNRIDADTSSAENLISQRYAQSGRAVNPAVLQRMRESAMQQKSDQMRQMQIAAAQANWGSRMQAAQQAQGLGQAEAGIRMGAAGNIGDYLKSVEYNMPDNAALLAALLRSMG